MGKIHPAIKLLNKYGWNNFLNKLELEVSNKWINKKVDIISSNLCLYNYSTKTKLKDHWNEFTTIARGLLLDIDKKEIVALPMPRFHHYGENKIFLTSDISFDVTKKIDGKLGIVYYDNYTESWRCIFRDSFDDIKLQWAMKWMTNNIDLTKLQKGTTYLFEIICKKTKQIIEYNYEGLVLITAYNNEGKEMKYGNLIIFSNIIGCKLIKREHFNKISDILLSARMLDKTQEGWVILIHNEYDNIRYKIKGDKYCKMYEIIHGINPLSIWNSILNNTLNDDLLDIEKEFYTDYNKIKKILFNNRDEVIKLIAEDIFKTNHIIDNKQLGLVLKTNKLNLSIYADKYLFRVRMAIHDIINESSINKIKQKIIDDEITMKFIYQIIKPVNNKLEGYIQSTIFNRFENSKQNISN
jgi:RNA ligase